MLPHNKENSICKITETAKILKNWKIIIEKNKKEIAGAIVVAREIKVATAEAIHSSGGDSLRACLW